MKTQPNFRAFSTFCFSAGAQRSVVGEIIMWLARTRDYILQFYTSRPTFPTIMTRTWTLGISETDVSSKKMNILNKPHRYLTNWTRSPYVLRVAVMPWQLCVDFSEVMGAVLQGEHPFEFVSAVLTIYTYIGPRVATRCLGTNIFYGEQYWQGFVGYSIAMAKPFLNNVLTIYTYIGPRVATRCLGTNIFYGEQY